MRVSDVKNPPNNVTSNSILATWKTVYRISTGQPVILSRGEGLLLEMKNDKTTMKVMEIDATFKYDADIVSPGI